MHWHQSADQSWHLKIQINAVPEKGKANQTLIRFLAKIFKIRQSAITILQGSLDRQKLLFIEGDSKILLEILRGYR